MNYRRSDVIYFEINNWMPKDDYPDEEPFVSWVCDYRFRDEEWVKENQLCIVEEMIDMSVNYCITAKKEWVMKNCPSLLTKHTKFLRIPDENGFVEGRFGGRFLEWSEENIGVFYEEVGDE